MGRAVAVEMARRGAEVAVWDINATAVADTAKTIEAEGHVAYASAVNVTSIVEIHSATEDVIAHCGRIDILVNCAGILYPTPFPKIKPEEWAQVLDVNLNGAFYCCQAVFECMKKQKFGRIVNISSSAGRSTSDLGGAHYTVSKAGVLGLTRHLAKEGGPEITVNAVCPGIIDTPMARTYGTEQQIEEIRRHLPLRRIGTPEDVADLVAFLASDAASYITGESIEIDGGELMI